MQTPGQAGSWGRGCGLSSFPERGPLCPSRSSPAPAPVAATSPEEASCAKERPGSIVPRVGAAVRAAGAARSPQEEFVGKQGPGSTMSSRGAGDRVVAAATAVAEADRAQEKAPGWATPASDPMLRAPVAWGECGLLPPGLAPPAQRLRAQGHPAVSPGLWLRCAPPPAALGLTEGRRERKSAV